MNTRAENEIAHGKKLVDSDPEKIWGWATPAGQQRFYRRVKMLAKGSFMKPGKTVLEIGCGSGLFTQALVQTGANIVAVDISDDLLQIARGRGLNTEQIQFLNQRFEDCDLARPFDAIIGSSVLHHLEVSIAIQKIFQLLKPGGWMCFTEPNMLNPQVALQKNIPWIKERMHDSPDETAFFRWSLARELKKAGFCEIEITPFDWLHPYSPPSLIPTIKKIGSWIERIPIAREFAGSVYIRACKPG